MTRSATAGTTLVCGLAFLACNNATSSDPATTERAALNPPTGLVSLTGDTKLTIQFSGANTESDFQGYDVFVVANKKMAEIAAGKKYYPANANIDPVAGVSQSIPRCQDNTAVFQAFGFPASTATCAGGGLSASSDTAATDTGLRLDDATTTGDAAPTQFIVCDGETDKTVSKKLSKPILGPETCVITKLSDGTALANGTTYSIFVATVAGDKKNKLSWTSNFIQDTPALGVYSDIISIAPATFTRFIPDNLTAATITKYATANIIVGTACRESVCKVNSANSSLGDLSEDGLYFGRQGSTEATGYPSRVLFSTAATGAFKVLPRGPRINTDPKTDAVIKDPPGLPDDQAIADATVYDGSGTLYPLDGYKVFDIVVTNTKVTPNTQHFGKIIIGQPNVTGDPITATSTVDLPISIIMQPQVGSTDYFTGH